MRRIQLRRRGDEGVAAVELAILLPVFLALTLGAIDLALAFRQQIMLRNAASNAAAYAAVQPCTLTGGSLSITQQAESELQSVSALKPSNVVVTTTFTDNAGAAVTGTDACGTASRVQVTVTAPYDLITGSFLSVFGLPQTLTVTGDETVQIVGRPA